MTFALLSLQRAYGTKLICRLYHADTLLLLHFPFQTLAEYHTLVSFHPLFLVRFVNIL